MVCPSGCEEGMFSSESGSPLFCGLCWREWGWGLSVSHFSEDFSRNIVIGIGHVCKTGFGIRCGFLRQLSALRVRAVF